MFGYGLGYGYSYGQALADEVFASLSVTFGDVAVSAAAAVEVSGGAGITFGEVTVESLGLIDVEAILSGSFGPVELSGEGSAGVSGTIFPFRPNWASSVAQALEFRTEVMRAKSGREQRIAVRESPRRSFEFSALVYSENRKVLNRLLDTASHEEYLFADPTRRAECLTPMPVGTGAVEVDAIKSWMVTSQPVLVSFADRTALRYIASIDTEDRMVSFGDHLPEGFDAGAKMRPVLRTYLSSEVATDRLTDNVAQMRFNLQTVPGSEIPATLPVAETEFAGREVWAEKPNWATPVQLTFGRSMEEVDFDKGVLSRFRENDFGERVYRLSYLARNDTEGRRATDFFCRMAGQQKEFWMPSWEDDLPVRSPAINGSTTLRLIGLETAQQYADSRTHKAIMLTTTTGQTYYRLVTSAYEINDGTGADTILQLNDSWPNDIPVENIRKLSWLFCCRHASDGFSIDWLTETKAQYQFAVKTLEALEAE